MNVELRHLRSFLVLAEELNFTRAAARLHVAQQALSTQIRQLEDELGAPLFVRSTRRVELTAAGRVLQRKAPSVMRDFDGMLKGIRSDATGAVSLTLGLLATSLLTFTPRLLRAFAAERPDVSVSVRNIPFTDPTGGVASRICDAALVWEPFTTRGLAVQPLFREERVAVLAADHPLAASERVSASTLAEEPFVWVDGLDPVARDFWTLADARAGKPAKIGAQVSGFEDLFASVRAGQAVAASPASIAGALPWTDLTTRPVDGLAPAVVAICWRPADGNRAVDDLVDCARRLAEDLP